ncbi:MAG: flippase-like domain-containing protein [Candidatus Dormibacteraeota bacterium]|nr:flippase-like domain-containing protein [Candidatus Dormibacteraeota bacterium]
MPVKVWLRRPLVRGIVASVVGIGFVVIVWRALGRPITWDSIHLAPLSLALASSGAVVFLAGRAWRFAILLPGQRGRLPRVAGVTGAGWGAGLLLPGPSGDVAFVAAARRVLGVSIARASGVAVLARILDLGSIALVAALAAAVSAGVQTRGVLVVAAVIAAGALVAFAALLIPGPRAALLGFAGRLPRLSGLAGRAETAMTELSRPRVTAGLLGSTALCRVATAVQYAGLMSLVGLHLGFWQTWFALSIRTLLFTVPIQGIAGIGTSQAWWTTGLVLEGVPLSAAVAASVTIQALDLAISLPLAAATSLFALAGSRAPRRVPVPASADVSIPVSAIGRRAVRQTQTIDGR